MSDTTVADTLAWTALPDEERATYRRAMEDETNHGSYEEVDSYEVGHEDGRSGICGIVASLLEDAETALAADPPNTEEAKRILNELRKEVG